MNYNMQSLFTISIIQSFDIFTVEVQYIYESLYRGNVLIAKHHSCVYSITCTSFWSEQNRDKQVNPEKVLQVFQRDQQYQGLNSVRHYLLVFHFRNFQLIFELNFNYTHSKCNLPHQNGHSGTIHVLQYCCILQGA